MILPVINDIIGGTRAPEIPIWDEITWAYEVQSAIYWAGVKKRMDIYRAQAYSSMPANVPGVYTAEMR